MSASAPDMGSASQGALARVCACPLRGLKTQQSSWPKHVQFGSAGRSVQPSVSGMSSTLAGAQGVLASAGRAVKAGQAPASVGKASARLLQQTIVAVECGAYAAEYWPLQVASAEKAGAAEWLIRAGSSWCRPALPHV